MHDPKNIRRSYEKHELSESDLTADPMDLFDTWFRIAVNEEKEPNAMVLATSVNDVPNTRVVLLKGYDSDGFVFYTNYNSEKGRELAANANVALNFFWENAERQIRILGKATRVSEKESDEYFQSRPFGSRIGAIASGQSKSLGSMQELIDKVDELALKYKDTDPPRPKHWGGYQVIPERIEFWQGKPERLHDRFKYTREGKVWKVERLYP